MNDIYRKRKEKYEQICILLPSGERKRWNEAATEKGLSLAEYIRTVIREDQAKKQGKQYKEA